MARRPVRIALVCLAVLLTGGLGYRAWLDAQALDAGQIQSVALERTVDDGLIGVANLRAALHASVAANQDASVWGARADVQLAALRQVLQRLDQAAAPSGRSFTEAIEQVAASERRVRAELSDRQPLLAADVIFTEMPTVLESVERQIGAARQSAQDAASSRMASLRRRQAAFVTAIIVVWIALALLLLPVFRDRQTAEPDLALSAPVEGGLDLSLTPGRHEVTFDVREDGSAAIAPKPTPHAGAGPALTAVAEVCTDLSSLSDHDELASALARACGLLGATGAIVWIAAHDGRSLSPGVAHGYDARVLGLIGAIATDSNNLTASAFRDGQTRATSASGSTPAALAIPMIGPAGPVGVLSAELGTEHLADVDLVALGTIFAAQLATLALPAPASPTGQRDRRREAQA